LVLLVVCEKLNLTINVYDLPRYDYDPKAPYEALAREQ